MFKYKSAHYTFGILVFKYEVNLELEESCFIALILVVSVNWRRLETRHEISEYHIPRFPSSLCVVLFIFKPVFICVHSENVDTNWPENGVFSHLIPKQNGFSPPRASCPQGP